MREGVDASGVATKFMRQNHVTRDGERTPASGETNGGNRRRVQQVCMGDGLKGRAAAVTAGCCDEPPEDCSGGRPKTCHTGSAALMLLF